MDWAKFFSLHKWPKENIIHIFEEHPTLRNSSNRLYANPQYKQKWIFKKKMKQKKSMSKSRKGVGEVRYKEN